MSKFFEKEFLRENEPSEKQKGIAFVFAHWVEKDNPTALDQESKERLNKTIELWQAGKIAYILVCGGWFVKGLKKSAALMMKDYLTNTGVPEEIIITESHSKLTTENVRYGHFLLNLKKLDDFLIYYVSSGYHLKRIELIVRGQKRFKKEDLFVSSGRDHLAGKERVLELLHKQLNKYDPEGKSCLAKWMRKIRS